MDTPNDSEVVNRVFAQGHFDLASKEGAGQFCEAVVRALHSVDIQWGHLKKSGAQNQFNGHAVDAALYRATGQTADFIVGAGDPGAKPGWSINTDDDYPPSSWFAPEGASEPATSSPDGAEVDTVAKLGPDVRASLGRVERRQQGIPVEGDAPPQEFTGTLRNNEGTQVGTFDIKPK